MLGLGEIPPLFRTLKILGLELSVYKRRCKAYSAQLTARHVTSWSSCFPKMSSMTAHDFQHFWLAGAFHPCPPMCPPTGLPLGPPLNPLSTLLAHRLNHLFSSWKHATGIWVCTILSGGSSAVPAGRVCCYRAVITVGGWGCSAVLHMARWSCLICPWSCTVFHCAKSLQGEAPCGSAVHGEVDEMSPGPFPLPLPLPPRLDPPPGPPLDKEDKEESTILPARDFPLQLPWALLLVVQI